MENDFSKSTIVKSHYGNDVIFGRGNGVSSWPGNIAFRHTVWKYRQQYMIARRRDKREIGRTVILEMKSLNGRFLIIDPKTGNYHEVSKKRAEDKACQSLREKEAKIPVGFDVKAMKNRKKWFRSIIRNPSLAQPQDCVANPNESLLDEKNTASSSSIVRHDRPSVAAKGGKSFSACSVPSPIFLSDHNASGKQGEHFMLGEDPIEYNEIINDDDDDDMSIITLDHCHMVHPTIPFPGASSMLSNQSVDGFGDDNSVLVDLKLWPEREDHVF